MRSRSFKGVTWYDCPMRLEKDVRSLERRFHFHELDIEDCLSDHERPKVEEYEKYLFLVFHIPYADERTKRIMKEEVSIFLGQNFVVTLHRNKIPILEKLWGQLQSSATKREEYLGSGTGFFLYELMHHFFDGTFPLVDQVYRALRSMEEQLFESDEERDLLRQIMNLKRNIITLRSILLPQRTLIATLEHKNKKFVSEELTLYFDDILDAIERQWALLDTAKEMIDTLQSTHESWLSHKTNAVIRVLTIFSGTMLPLTFLTGLYGMNVRLPLAEQGYTFLLLISVMLAIIVGMIAFFSRKRWL